MYKNKIPRVSPFRRTGDLHLRYIVIHRKWDKAQDERLFGAISYRWEGWTDGAVWVVNRKPVVPGSTIVFTSIVIIRDEFIDNYRKYTYISAVPALFYSSVSVRMSVSKMNRDMLVFSDTKKSIAIWRPHIRIFYTTFGKNEFTLWIHPVLNSYTVTVGDSIVGFGLGIPEENILLGAKTLEKNKRDAIIQVRRWWRSKAENTGTDSCEEPELLFQRRIANYRP